jgi:hypothetical protein
MKKQYLLKQVCGLCIGVAGTLVPLSSVQAADELSDRYTNGYLNDPYTNEVAADTKSVLPRGAEGPIRADATPMTQTRERFEPVSEAYSPPVQSPGGSSAPMWTDTGTDTSSRGAQGPIRTDASNAEDRTMKPAPKRFEPVSEAYNPTGSE